MPMILRALSMRAQFLASAAFCVATKRSPSAPLYGIHFQWEKVTCAFLGGKEKHMKRFKRSCRSSRIPNFLRFRWLPQTIRIVDFWRYRQWKKDTFSTLSSWRLRARLYLNVSARWSVDCLTPLKNLQKDTVLHTSARVHSSRRQQQANRKSAFPQRRLSEGISTKVFWATKGRNKSLLGRCSNVDTGAEPKPRVIF